MQRLKDTVLNHICEQVNLADCEVLEIGCGNGAKSQALAQKCTRLYAIDPDEPRIREAHKLHAAENIMYQFGRAEELSFEESQFDVVLFSLSFHHVAVDSMQQALAEAIRVTKPQGKIIIVEPGFIGSFYEAEIQFGASDGDERLVKAIAYAELLKKDNLQEEAEMYGDVVLHFDSDTDFISTLQPDRNLKKISDFLERHNYSLLAQPRINIFSVA